jgi:hypothetical protein
MIRLISKSSVAAGPKSLRKGNSLFTGFQMKMIGYIWLCVCVGGVILYMEYIYCKLFIYLELYTSLINLTLSEIITSSDRSATSSRARIILFTSSSSSLLSRRSNIFSLLMVLMPSSKRSASRQSPGRKSSRIVDTMSKNVYTDK